jgi:hypothetical protein
MTIREILKLPTADLEALDDKALNELLSPLIPAARAADKQAAADKDLSQLLKQAQALLGGK